MSSVTLFIDGQMKTTNHFESDSEMLSWINSGWTQQRLIWTDKECSLMAVNEHRTPHFLLVKETDAMPIHACIELLKNFNAKAFEGRTVEEQAIEAQLEREFALISERDSFLETMIAYDRL